MLAFGTLQELPEARRFRETARELLGFDPLDGPGVLGFYELLRGPEGRIICKNLEVFGTTLESVESFFSGSLHLLSSLRF